MIAAIFFLKVFTLERGIIPAAAPEADSAGRGLTGEHQSDNAKQNRNHEGMTAVLVGIEYNQATGIGCDARQERDDQHDERSPQSPPFASANGHKHQHDAGDCYRAGQRYRSGRRIGCEHRRVEMRMRPCVRRRCQRHVLQQQVRHHNQANANLSHRLRVYISRASRAVISPTVCTLHIVRPPINIRRLLCLKL
jgi:hypothetical protein